MFTRGQCLSVTLNKFRLSLNVGSVKTYGRGKACRFCTQLWALVSASRGLLRPSVARAERTFEIGISRDIPISNHLTLSIVVWLSIISQYWECSAVLLLSQSFKKIVSWGVGLNVTWIVLRCFDRFVFLHSYALLLGTSDWSWAASVYFICINLYAPWDTWLIK